MDKVEFEGWVLDAGNLRDLMKQPGWETYLKFMDRVIAEMTDVLLTPADPSADYLHQVAATERCRGYIQGLKRAVGLPKEVFDNVERARQMVRLEGRSA